MQRILSGVRPTGDVHLGNYLGAIKNWVHLQNQAEQSLFCVVDLHALTTVQETENLAHNTRVVAAAYIASGIDPNQSSIFPQSFVTQHCELAWILGCLTPLGWLNRMTQFKDKAGKNKELACLGLYAYPVLQAADILIYKATHVPVGEDQKQHLELARDIAGAFNRRFNCSLLPLPEPIIQGQGTRVMSLREGDSKMSKSDPSDYSRLNLMDDAETVRLKIRKAKTDSEPLPATMAELSNRPEALNLLTLYGALRGESLETICPQFEGQSFSQLKLQLTDALIETVVPIGDKMRDLLKSPDELDSVLKKGAQSARAIAQETLKNVRETIGILS